MECEELRTCEEANVTYAWPKIMQGVPMRAPGWRVFAFRWTNVATGDTDVKHVLCRNGRDFLTLLHFWNRDSRWNYSVA